MNWGRNEGWKELLKATEKKIVAGSVIDWRSLKGLIERYLTTLLPLTLRN